MKKGDNVLIKAGRLQITKSDILLPAKELLVFCAMTSEFATPETEQRMGNWKDDFASKSFAAQAAVNLIRLAMDLEHYEEKVELADEARDPRDYDHNRNGKKVLPSGY